nr:MAG: RNA-dependent RNA polymerase [Leviviridae sp.]
MKSQVNALLLVEKGLLTDASSAYPALRESFLKDMGRLTLNCQSRGLGFFTLDLPNLDSLLLKGLESGRLVLEGPASKPVSKRVKVPRLFSGLWLRVFDKDACLKQEVDVTALAFIRQLCVIGKKLEVECTHERRNAVAEAYHDIEAKLRRPTLQWDNDNFGIEWPSLGGVTQLVGVDGGSLPSDQLDLPIKFPISGMLNGSHYGDLSIPAISRVEGQRNGKGSFPRWSGGKGPGHLVQALDHLDRGPLFNSQVLHEGGGTEGTGAGFPFSKLEDQRLLNRVQNVADLIIERFRTYDPLLFSEECEESFGAIGFKHGPGAVAERLRGWNKSSFPNWSAKLDAVFPFEQVGKTANSDVARPLNHEVPSRLIGVPKTAKGPRLIAAESVSHQWCQQLTWQFLQGECHRLFGDDFLTFRDQSHSGNMAIQASKDRKLATVDLSDASDRLSCWTVERMFRKSPSLLVALHAARTRYLRDEVSEKMDFLLLRKFASQGTATTFPIMSLTMLFIALGCTLDGEVTWKKIMACRNQVRVFGDDIILPSHGYARLLRVMELLQLKINMAKSYVNGGFRESCGVDGYDGYDVTPVKPQKIVADGPASCQAVVDISNNLFNKGYWHASTACVHLLPPRVQRGLRMVDRNDAGLSGLYSHSGGNESHLSKRWNSSLHRWEVRTWSSSERKTTRPREGYATLLDFLSNKHSHERARTVSEYVAIRKTKAGLSWEPSRYHDHVSSPSGADFFSRSFSSAS